MKFAFKSIVAAAAFVAAGAAGAASASSLTLTSGSSVTDQGWTVSNLTGSGTLSFSSTLIGALIVGVFRNGLQLMGVGSIYQVLITGILVIVAVSIDYLSHRGGK